nr:EAL domain-containing protein [Bilophila wadsworthia]
MIGRAKALKETSTELRGRLRYAVYDDAIRRQLFREKRLKNIMGAALQNREFQVYLQPKYRTESETIGGAEALVRWMGAEGMIYPDEFIPLFEKNGFIISWTFGCSKSFASAPGKSTDELLPRATQIPFSWSAISKSARGAARRRNTLKSSSRKTWCSRTWANSARSSKPSMRPVPVALWTTSGAAIPPST